MAVLLTKASPMRTGTNYVFKILEEFKQTPTLSPNGNDQPLVEDLSERELDVLSLVSLGLSNNEIGARLFLALSTVKGHNQNIFDKLKVRNRTEAVARARELGLLIGNLN